MRVQSNEMQHAVKSDWKRETQTRVVESQYCTYNGRKPSGFGCRRIEATEAREAANESGRLQVASCASAEFEASRI